MKCYFRSFDVGIGDCNIIRLVKDDGTQYVIMVDCGEYTKPLKEYLQNKLQNHIDLLIATHIDGDHIQGMATMLKEHDGLTIGKIWYNCYRRREDAEVIELNAQQNVILEQIRKALPVEFDAINYKPVSATQGKSLAKAILDNEEFKKVWEAKYITCDTENFDIPGDFGKIVFLAPKPDALQTIENKFNLSKIVYIMI